MANLQRPEHFEVSITQHRSAHLQNEILIDMHYYKLLRIVSPLVVAANTLYHAA
jgi:hypothetical protein